MKFEKIPLWGFYQKDNNCIFSQVCTHDSILNSECHLECTNQKIYQVFDLKIERFCHCGHCEINVIGIEFPFYSKGDPPKRWNSFLTRFSASFELPKLSRTWCLQGRPTHDASILNHLTRKIQIILINQLQTLNTS